MSEQMSTSDEKLPEKPGPLRIPTNEPFWAGAEDGELRLQHCVDCGRLQHYPRALCARCWGTDLDWVASSGNGRVWTYTVVHRPVHPAWSADVPYVIAVVELDEGPRLLTGLAGVQPEEVRVHLPVEAVFVRRGTTTLVYFAPKRDGARPDDPTVSTTR